MSDEPHKPTATGDVPSTSLTSVTPELPAGDELAALVARDRKPRSPIVGSLVLVVAGILLHHLWPDLSFALGPKSPVDLGDARAADPRRLADNTFVAVRGAPDYRNALLFEPRGDNYRRAFYRLLGTHSRIWVRAEETSTRHALTGPSIGRLRRFDALPYAEQVRSYYETQVKVQRLLDLDELRSKLGGGAPVGLHDRGGEPVEATEGGDVDVVVDFPDELLVSLSRDKFAVEEDARRELARLGAPVGPVLTTATDFTFPVRFAPAPAPGASSDEIRRAVEASRNAYIARLDEKYWGFRIRREHFSAAISGFAPGSEPGTLSIPSSPSHPALFDAPIGMELKPRPASARTLLPWDRIDSIQLASPIRIPHDAWIVVESEDPRDFLYAPALAALLGLFAAFNVWWLLRSRPGR